MTIKIVSSTMGVSTPASVAEGTGWYRYNGKQPLKADPDGTLPQNAKATAGKQQRMAEYARLRLEGASKDEAAERIGIKASTAAYYEREYQDQQRRESRDG